MSTNQINHAAPENRALSTPSNLHVLHQRESALDTGPRRELGDDVIEQASRWEIPVLIVLVALIVTVIIGTAYLAG